MDDGVPVLLPDPPALVRPAVVRPRPRPKPAPAQPAPLVRYYRVVRPAPAPVIVQPARWILPALPPAQPRAAPMPQGRMIRGGPS